MITIALLGGYLNICFVASSIDFKLAFGYLIFLNLLSLIYAYRNPEKSVINIFNLVVTLLITTPLMISSNELQPTYPVILWLIYLVYDVVKTNKNPKEDSLLQILSWTNFGILAGFSLILFRDEKLYIGSILIIAAIVYNLIPCSLLLIRRNFENYTLVNFGCYIGNCCSKIKKRLPCKLDINVLRCCYN